MEIFTSVTINSSVTSEDFLDVLQNEFIHHLVGYCVEINSIRMVKQIP
jgi:hypothetical protein